MLLKVDALARKRLQQAQMAFDNKMVIADIEAQTKVGTAKMEMAMAKTGLVAQVSKAQVSHEEWSINRRHVLLTYQSPACFTDLSIAGMFF